jgi:hypothetical protein
MIAYYYHDEKFNDKVECEENNHNNDSNTNSDDDLDLEDTQNNEQEAGES